MPPMPRPLTLLPAPPRRSPLRLLRVCLIAAAVSIPLAGASDLPDLGDVARSVLSAQEERRIGIEVMREVRIDRSYFDDPVINDYLNNLGYRLAANSPDSRIGFEFFVMRDPSVNAFALPGGFIGVHTGLVSTAQTESELAAVVAHEIAHVTQGHIARLVNNQQQAQFGSLIAMAVALLAARSNPQVAQGALIGAQAAVVQSQLNFTRDMERDADRVGLAILDQSGFDVRGMSSFFERMQRATRALETTAPAYLRTHPMTTERIADTLNRIDAMPYRQVRDNPEFQFVRARLLAGQGNPREAVEALDSGLKRGAFASEAAQRYGLVVALMRLRDYPRALQEMKALRRIAPPLALVEALEGELLVAAGETKAAVAFYPGALARYPRYRPLVYDYADLLIRIGRPADAQRLAADQLQFFPSDHRLHFAQARAYGAQGRVLAQGRAFAEGNLLLGNFELAIEQLQNALKVGDGDFFELSSAEARLRELRAAQLAAKKR